MRVLYAVGAATAKPWFWRGDLESCPSQVLTGRFAPRWPERQLEGLEADRAAEDLVTEADPEDGHLCHQLATDRDDVAEEPRIAPGPFAGKIGSGSSFEHRLGARARRAASVTRAPSRSRRLTDDRRA
jgi:hypothetical protein